MDSSNNLSPLIEEIEKERDWRISEFRRIKSIQFAYKDQNKYFVTYSSMCIPMIYAHWEGFCVSVFRIVANYINNQNLTYNEINNSLFTYSHDKTYNYLKGKQGFQQRCKFSTDFLSTISTKKIKIIQKFDCKSNLKFKVLLNMFEVLGSQNSNLDKYSRDIDKLVEVRNAIAHGENSIVVDFQMVHGFIETVVKLYDEIILILIEYLRTKKYLKI